MQATPRPTASGWLNVRLRRRSFLAGAAVVAVSALSCRAKPSGTGAARGQSSGPGAAGGTQAYNSFLGRTGKSPSGSPVMGGTYRAFLLANPPSLDPHRSVSVYTANAASPVYSRLLRMKTAWDVPTAYRFQTEGDLAQSVESPDGVTWTVKLRSDATFHNLAPVSGHAVEAEDVKATFERATSSTNVNRNSVAMVDGTKLATPDNRTVVFTLKYPYGQFPTILASNLAGWILPREVRNSGYDPAKQVIGSGPFLFDSYTPDVSVKYRKNPTWFEKGRPYVDGAELAVVPDAAQQLAQFTAGNVGDIGIMQPSLDAARQQNPKADVLTLAGGSDWLLWFNLGDPVSPFKDIRLRQAASLAIDREVYGHVMFNDQDAIGFSVPLTLGRWALTLQQLSPDTQRWYKYDPTTAKQLFTAAGGDKLALKILKPTPIPTDPFFTNAGQIVANALAQAGWNAPMVNIDYTREWLGDGKGIRYGNYPGTSLIWVGLGVGTNADDFISGFWESSSISNLARLKDPTVDQMIAKARATISEDEQVQAYQDVQKYIAGQVYCASGLPRGPNFTLTQPWVQNYLISPNGAPGTDTWSNLWLTH